MSIEGVRPVRRGRLPQQVVEGIQRLIAEGTYHPGDRLPNEGELAHHFAVGRNSIREAIRQLELLGIVEVRQGDGTFVRQLDGTTMAEPFRVMLALSDRSARAVFDFRRILEPGIAALAAEHASSEDARLMEEALRRKVALQRTDDAPAVLEQDLDFHLLLARATGNPLVYEVHKALLGLLRQFRLELSRQSAYSEELTIAERAVLDAVRRRQPDEASQAMRRHMEVLVQFLREE
jgi:GntR family transcriptional repressor for pyruvate dehydrogenase complex